MPDNSFDVVSIVDLPEVLNAVQQARKEALTRFDLKDSKSEIELNEKDKKLTVNSIDDYKLKAVVDARHRRDTLCRLLGRVVAQQQAVALVLASPHSPPELV
jgi:uncharacterized protein YajQ (UPF0234 family)